MLWSENVRSQTSVSFRCISPMVSPHCTGKTKGRSFHAPPLHSTASHGTVQSQSTTALVERTGDHVELLFLGELDEVHRVAGDAHGQVRVLLRMLDGILELLLAQHVDVGVVQAVAIAGVQDANEVADTLFLVAAQTIRVMVLVSEMPSRASL